MKPKAPMLSVQEALDYLMQAVRPVAESETLPTEQCWNRVLASDQLSQLDVPPADNTQMDGYAVRAADCTSGDALLPVSQRIPAGVVGAPLQAGTAARIFTGAMIPAGADAVVMQEDTRCDDARPDQVQILDRARPWENVRLRGEDVKTGTLLAATGTRLTAGHVSLFAAVGTSKVRVARQRSEEHTSELQSH